MNNKQICTVESVYTDVIIGRHKFKEFRKDCHCSKRSFRLWELSKEKGSLPNNCFRSKQKITRVIAPWHPGRGSPPPSPVSRVYVWSQTASLLPNLSTYPWITQPACLLFTYTTIIYCKKKKGQFLSVFRCVGCAVLDPCFYKSVELGGWCGQYYDNQFYLLKNSAITLCQLVT